MTDKIDWLLPVSLFHLAGTSSHSSASVTVSPALVLVVALTVFLPGLSVADVMA